MSDEVTATAEELNEGLPSYGIQRTPLTACINYNMRWRINELKMMLSDLQYLTEKHKIENAKALYLAVQNETEELCTKLRDFIVAKRSWREELSK